ncbi:MAG: cofactor-independent phosphoglycerate mutase [Bacteroidales bacterium]|nr:cofactor-independent phosphoglycerate mutase [Bacteroidales bacterium]
MRYLIVLGDGMADEPIEALDGKTPMQTALTPMMDFLAREGRCGLLQTVPDGFAPGSEIANMGLLGYDVSRQFEGRGSLEAASMGVHIDDGVMAARCNLICIENGKIKNHSAGHISNEEAAQLIDFLNEKLGTDRLRLCAGISYRHLLLLKGGDKRLVCTPPHDVPGTEAASVMIRPAVPEAQPTADLLNEFILRSQEILPTHPVNMARRAAGKDMANSVWPWSPGYRPSMRPMTELFPAVRSGAVISAVDLIKGIGVYAGLEPVEVEGATGLYDTNYEGKAQAAIEALRRKDFVFLHVEASDEAGHEGDVDLKIRTIEYLDHRLLEPIVKEVSTWDEPVTIAVLPDHPTFCRTRLHMALPVPFLIWRSQGLEPDGQTAFQPDQTEVFDELSARQGSYGLLHGDEFIRLFFNGKTK